MLKHLVDTFGRRVDYTDDLQVGTKMGLNSLRVIPEDIIISESYVTLALSVRRHPTVLFVALTAPTKSTVILED